MPGSKPKGKARAASSNNIRATQKRSSFASAATRSSYAAALASQSSTPSFESSSDHSDSGLNLLLKESNLAVDASDSPINKSLLPEKSDQELKYDEIIKVLNTSIAASFPENPNLSITEAIPSVRELVSLRYDLKRLLEVSTTQLSECDKNLSNLKRLSTALDRESTKRMKALSSTVSNTTTDASKSKASPTGSNDKIDSIKEPVTASKPASKSNSFSKLNDIVTIKTEPNDSDTTALFTDTIGLNEPGTKHKTPPEYEKNPKSEFVEAQELPIAALNLFEDQVKGLPTTGKEYLLKKFAVASYPADDLKDWLPGTIPDLDFTKAKPPNQVQFSTFASYIEPYFRPFVEEDLHFLEQKIGGSSHDYSYMPVITGTGAAAKEAVAVAAAKQAQLSPYVIPKIGRIYSEVWKELDGPNPGYTFNPIEPPDTKDVTPYGSFDQITDVELGKNDISCGPLASRLLSAILNEGEVENALNGKSDNNDVSDDENSNRAPTNTNDKPSNDDALKSNGPIVKQEIKSETSDTPNIQKPDTFESEEENEKNDNKGKSMTLENTNWKVNVKNKDFLSLEERLNQELKYVGIIDLGMLKKEEQQKQRFEDLTGPPIIPLPPAAANHKGGSAGTAIHGEEPGEKENKFMKINESFDIDWVNGREDDEISTELRYLQRQLRRVSRLKMAYQRALHPIVQQQLAWQEYCTILEDLDKQVDQVYMRRNRATTRIKKKKTTSHGTANGGNHSNSSAISSGAVAPGTAAANATEQTQRIRSLLEKRSKWSKMIEPVFGSSKAMKAMPKESVFSQVDVDEIIRNSDSMAMGGDYGHGGTNGNSGSGHGANGQGGTSSGNGGNEEEVEDAMMNAFKKTRGGTPSTKVEDLWK